MRPLLSRFLEPLTGSPLPENVIEYSYDYDLHINTESRLPVFDSTTRVDSEGRFVSTHLERRSVGLAAFLATETLTKVQRESTDDDQDRGIEFLQAFVETEISTQSQKESASGDPELGLEALQSYLETQSGTKQVKEQSDDDAPFGKWY